MVLPKQLEPLRARRVWVCYPMIYNEKKHNGVGGYDKPPINPYTLRNGYTDREESLATFDEAAAQIGKTAKLNVKGYEELVETPVVGVGIAFGGTGVAGVDLDNVVEKRESGKGYKATDEALEIMKALRTYTEISPKVIISLVAAFIYFVKGIDLIPDFIPIIGRVDDLAILGAALKVCEPELAAFEQWRENGKETV